MHLRSYVSVMGLCIVGPLWVQGFGSRMTHEDVACKTPLQVIGETKI
jgi:hypothetical protein